MKHYYKAALESFKKYDDAPIETSDMIEGLFGRYMERHQNTIRHALLMMQKLQEPSDGMLLKLYSYGDLHAARYAFRDMLEQAEKEIEG